MAVVYFRSWENFNDPGAVGDANNIQLARDGLTASGSGTDSPRIWLTDGPFGGAAISTRTLNGWLNAQIGQAVGPTFMFACWIKTDSATWGCDVFNFYAYGRTGKHCAVEINSSGQVVVKRNTVTLGTSTLTVPVSGVWSHFAIKYLIDNASGTVDVEVDGTSYLSLTAQDTLESSYNAEIQSWEIASNKYEHLFRIAQPIVWTTAGDAPTDLFGLHKIWALRPNADTAQQDFAQSAGSDAYAMVDEAEADDDSTYNHTSTATDKDRLDVANMPETPQTIYGVQAVVLHKQSDAGARGVKPGLYSGTTESAAATAHGSGINYKYGYHLTTKNPDDAAVWEEADVNAVKVQYEAT